MNQPIPTIDNIHIWKKDVCQKNKKKDKKPSKQNYESYKVILMVVPLLYMGRENVCNRKTESKNWDQH